MKKQELSNQLVQLANKYNVNLYRDVDNLSGNCGASAGHDEIMLGNYDYPDTELITFFHELAHCKFAEHMKQWFNILPVNLSLLSWEGLCWEYGLILAKDNGYEWKKDSRAYKYAYNKFLSYIGNEYDEYLKEKM